MGKLRRQRKSRLIGARFETEAARGLREMFVGLYKESVERHWLIDTEPEKRNGSMQAVLARGDRVFEMLTTRSNALANELMGVSQRTAPNEARLDVIEASDPQRRPKSVSAADEPHGLAAQHIPGEK